MNFERVTLGTAGLGGAWQPVNEKESINTILFALERGINHIDMAPAYMNAEQIVAKVLKHWSGNKPFLSTKVGKRRGAATQKGLIDYSNSYIEHSLINSLKILQIDCIDLLFLHEPDQIPSVKLDDVMDQVIGFKNRGLIKKIGLGGQPSEDLKQYIEQGYIDVVMDFNGFNLIENKAINDFIYYKQHGLKIYEGSPLMMGLLGRRLDQYVQMPPNWLSNEQLNKALKFHSLAVEYGVELSTLAHRYLLFQCEIDRMVIGPRNDHQMRVTLNDIEMGPLPFDIVHKINQINQP